MDNSYGACGGHKHIIHPEERKELSEAQQLGIISRTEQQGW
ncbi:hypothetical protein ACFLT4_04275 [Chloroflexota bacterium]